MSDTKAQANFNDTVFSGIIEKIAELRTSNPGAINGTPEEVELFHGLREVLNVVHTKSTPRILRVSVEDGSGGTLKELTLQHPEYRDKS